MLVLDLVLDLLPLHPERWVGQHVVEGLAGVAVVGEGVAEGDVLRILSLDHEVGPADRPRFGVQLLPVDLHRGVLVELGDQVVHRREHAARAAGRVEHRAHRARKLERVAVRGDQQPHHELDDLTGREVLTGRLVGLLGEAADQLLEDVAHVVVGHDLGTQVQVRELADDLVEQSGTVQPLDLLGELETLQHALRVVREGPHVHLEVHRSALRILRDLLQRQARPVVEGVPRGPPQEAVRVDAAVLVLFRDLRDLLAGRLQHALQSPQHRERQDDLAVVGLLVVPPQEVGDGPRVVRQLRVLTVVQLDPRIPSEMSQPHRPSRAALSGRRSGLPIVVYV